MPNNTPKYVFFDVETTGLNVRYDQIIQFAAILVDENFNEIDTINIKSKLLPYIVPSPKAMEVTRFVPDHEQYNMTQLEFATHLYKKISEWTPAIFIGQNIIRFDREILRSMFWMNLIEDPYIMSGRGSRELDILPIFRFIHASDPSSLKVPTHPDNGRPVFKLDQIAPLNGFNDEGKAHDALIDVKATIFLAKTLKQNHPDLWEKAIACTDTQKNKNLLNNGTSLYHLNLPFGIQYITKITDNPLNPKQTICFNLEWDPAPFLSLPPEEIAVRLFKTNSPFVVIKTNTQPMLSAEEPSFFSPKEPVDHNTIAQRIDTIRNHRPFQEACAKAITIANSAPIKKNEPINVEEQIYEGFCSDSDKALIRNWHKSTSWHERYEIGNSFADPRLQEISSRLVYLYSPPETMPPKHRNRIEKHFIENRLLGPEEAPWTTLNKAEASLNEVANPEMREIISNWLKKMRSEAEERLLKIQKNIIQNQNTTYYNYNKTKTRQIER